MLSVSEKTHGKFLFTEPLPDDLEKRCIGLRCEMPFIGHGKEKRCDKGKDCKRAFQSPGAACGFAGKAEGFGVPATDGGRCGENEIYRKEQDFFRTSDPAE